MTKPVRYFLRGIVADVIILAAVSLFVLVSIALSYKGRCGVFWFFGGDGHPCSRSEYVKEEAGFLFFALLDNTETLLLILPALGILPLLGYLLGRRRESKSTMG
jgi:hypothetical protein